MSVIGSIAARPLRFRPHLSGIWMLAVAGAAMACLPLGYLLVRAAEADADAWSRVLSDGTLRLLLNTAALAAAVTAASAALALPIAYLTERTDLPFARWWRSATIMPLAIPSYVGAFAFIIALGPNGSLQNLLAPLGVQSIPEIYGFFGAWLTLTLFTFPYLLLVIRAGLRDLDPAIEESARSLGQTAWGAFWRVTVPQLRVPLAAGSLLVALYVISDFGAVSMMQFDTFTRAIYIRFGSAFDRSSVAVLCLVLVALVFVVLAIDWSQRRNARYHRVGSGTARAPRLIGLRRLRWPALIGLALVTSIALVVPVAVLFHWLSVGLQSGETFPGVWSAALNSVYASALAGGVTVAVSIPIAIVVVRRPGMLSRLVDRAAYVGYALPGVVVAFALIFFSLRAVPGLYQTIAVLIFAYAVLFLPQAISGLRSSLVRVQPGIEEASRALNRNSWQTFFSVTLPLITPGVLAGFALVFLTTMKELPATLLLAPIEFDTLATNLWGHQEDVFFARAAASGLLLLVCAALPMIILFGNDRGLRT
ncbi:MAG: iron ABC transporter permease [Chloroflexi bacterium]|nr:iron ABC transporter permease [Chloroflexota bacterium]MYD16741.1 iron ABC transporter permease [Chloroflexota bacterium]MYJ01967.1 iron ABC transporter permease [Chloroflexota bacterium]